MINYWFKKSNPEQLNPDLKIVAEDIKEMINKILNKELIQIRNETDSKFIIIFTQDANFEIHGEHISDPDPSGWVYPNRRILFSIPLADPQSYEKIEDAIKIHLKSHIQPVSYEI